MAAPAYIRTARQPVDEAGHSSDLATDRTNSVHRPAVYLRMAKRAAGDSRIAVAYLRVSTSRQELGPEAQRSAIEAHAAREGIRIVAWHADRGVSGAAPIEARPGLLAALAALGEHRAGVLVVAKRDRLARDVVVAALVEREAAKAGACVVSADGAGNGSTPADQFMRSMLDAASAYERALIRARTKAALAAKRARGEHVAGLVPYGHRLADDGVHLEPHADEQATIAIVRELASAGLSQRAIVSRLAELGVVGRTGRPLQRTQVLRLLERRAA